MSQKEHPISDNIGLCFRCEHRAQFQECGSRPRFECGFGPDKFDRNDALQFWFAAIQDGDEAIVYCKPQRRKSEKGKRSKRGN
jgi:hypothetical protein